MSTKRVLGAAAVACALIAAGCGSSGKSGGGSAGGGSTGTTSTKQLKVGFINLADGVAFPAAVKKGILAEAAKENVEVLACDSNLDAQKAQQCAQSFKTQGVQGIINFQIDTTAAPRICAAGPNVPVVAIDIPQPPCEKVFYGANNSEAGKLSGAVLGEYAKSKWNCQADAFLTVNHFAAGKVVLDRENGGIAGVHESCPNLKNVHIETKATTDTTIQPVRDALSRYPGKHKIIIFATNVDQSIGVIKAAQQLGRLNDVYLAGQGADPPSWPYICGKEQFKNWLGDTAYFPEDYGKAVVPAIVALINGKSVPRDIYIDHKVVTPQNIKDVFPQACQ